MAYDVSDDALRARVAELIDDYGVRIQESVFECSMEDMDYARLRTRLSAELVGQQGAHVRFYPVCGQCVRGIVDIGDRGDLRGSKGWVIV